MNATTKTPLKVGVIERGVPMPRAIVSTLLNSLAVGESAVIPITSRNLSYVLYPKKFVTRSLPEMPSHCRVWRTE